MVVHRVNKTSNGGSCARSFPSPPVVVTLQGDQIQHPLPSSAKKFMTFHQQIWQYFLGQSLRGSSEPDLINTLEINLLYTINYCWIATQIY